MQPDAQLAQQVLDVQPFSVWLAAKVRHFESGAVDIEMACRADLTQHHGYVHGGVVCALARARSLSPKAGRTKLTLEFAGQRITEDRPAGERHRQVR